MSKAVALLRGIDVGGRAALLMAKLRPVCETPGRRAVQTYIQERQPEQAERSGPAYPLNDFPGAIACGAGGAVQRPAAVALAAEILAGAGRAGRRFVARRGPVLAYRGHRRTRSRWRRTTGVAFAATARRAGVSPRAA